MLRTQTSLTGEYTYVSRYDDALDSDAPDFELRWQQYLDGTAEAPIKAGASPTVFHLRHLKAGEFNALLRSDANGFDLARAALIGVSGAPIPGWKFAMTGRDRKTPNIDDAPTSLYAVFMELGSRVIARMTPPGK